MLLAGACLLVGVAFGARGAEPRVGIADVRRALVHWQSDNEELCPPSLTTLYEEHYLPALPRGLTLVCDADGANVR